MTLGSTCDGAGSAQATSTSAAAAAVASTSGSKGSTGGGGGVGTPSSTGGAAMKKGPWTALEDATLMEYVKKHGEGNWNAVQKNSGLSRCGKSCRLRWANHLRPNLKKGPFSPDEERLILELHAKLGNKWARMAAQLPGRTDNEIKNYWNTRIKRRQRAGLPLYPPDIQHQTSLHHHYGRSMSGAMSPLSDHKPLYSTSIGATPLSLYDPINYASPTPVPAPATTTSPLLGLGQPRPFLTTTSSAGATIHQPRLKRLREDDGSGFSLPFSTGPAAPPPPQNPLVQFNSLGSYDLSPLPQPPQRHQQQSFSVKMELPSSQLFPEQSRAIAGGGGDGAGSPFLGRSNCELLDALLRDAQNLGSRHDGKSGSDGEHQRRDGLLPEAGNGDGKWVKGDADGELSQGLILGRASGEWDDSDRPVDAATIADAAEVAGSVDVDLSALLDLIPMAAIPAVAVAAAAATQQWYNSDSGEVSNGQSSGVTDDNVGLEMQQLASSLSMAAEEGRSWTIASCHWNDIPGTSC